MEMKMAVVLCDVLFPIEKLDVVVIWIAFIQL